MPQLPPTNIIEFNARFFENQRISGFGPGGVTMHIPCPFCAAPEFLVYKVMESRDALEKGSTCEQCGRGAKALFTETSGDGVRFEIVQTGGQDQPDWLDPKMRRIA